MKPIPLFRLACRLVLACSFGAWAGGAGAEDKQPAPPVFRVPTAPLPPAVPEPEAVWHAPNLSSSAAAKYNASDLERLAAPIALYADPLIAIMLPAAVYPLEIVQAARFVSDTNNLTKLEDQPWDPNVKAVARVPALIQKMNADLSWTVDLGQAFVSQQKDLMDTIQALRVKAQSAGTLKSTPEQNVLVTNAVVARTFEQQVVYVTNSVVQIQPANPQVVYVPQYAPSVVYAPAAYVDPFVPLVTFGVGIAFGAIFANTCDWYYGGVWVGGCGSYGYGYGSHGYGIVATGGYHPAYYPPPAGSRPPPYQPPPGGLPPAGPPPGGPPPGGPPPANPTPNVRSPATTLATAPRASNVPNVPATAPAVAGQPAPAGKLWQPDAARLNGSAAPRSMASAGSRQPSVWTSPGARPGGSLGAAVTRPASFSSGSSRPSSSRPSSFSRPSPSATFAGQPTAVASASRTLAAPNASRTSGSPGWAKPAAPATPRPSPAPSAGGFGGMSSAPSPRGFSSGGGRFSPGTGARGGSAARFGGGRR